MSDEINRIARIRMMNGDKYIWPLKHSKIVMFLFSFPPRYFLFLLLCFLFTLIFFIFPSLLSSSPSPHFLRSQSDIIICRTHLSFLNWVAWGASRGLRAETKVRGARDEVRQTVWAWTANTALPSSLRRDYPQF